MYSINSRISVHVRIKNIKETFLFRFRIRQCEWALKRYWSFTDYTSESSFVETVNV